MHFRFAWTFFLIPAVIDAAQPNVTRLEPIGVQRGGERTVILHGTKLKDARQVLTYEPGLTIKEVTPKDDGKVEVKIDVAEDCRLGLHPLQLVTASGIAQLRLLGVGQLPNVDEKEPNNDYRNPQPIELGWAVNGTITSEDEDYFAVELKAGERMVIEVEGIRAWAGLRNDFFDPHVSVLDVDRNQLIKADDETLLYQDPVCVFTAREDGRFLILVRDSAYGGGSDCYYRMQVGSFPRPLAVFPPQGEAGKTLDATFIETDGLTFSRTLQLPSLPTSPFAVTVESAEGSAPSPNWIRVADGPIAIEQEPNDGIKFCNRAEFPVAFCGVIEKPGDEDWFEFNAKKGEKITVQCHARKDLRSKLDSTVTIFGPDQKPVANNDDSGGPDSMVSFTVATDGPHRVQILDHLKRGGRLFTYSLEVGLAKASLNLTLPEVRRDETVNIAVPRGGRMAVMLNAARQDFSGPIALQAHGLPSGIDIVSPTLIPADQNSLPLLFEANRDAPLGATLTRITGQQVPAEENKPIVCGELALRHKLVRGQNRREVFGVDSSRVAISVIEASPVLMEAISPQVPLVRNGSFDLMVKVDRPEGYKHAIPVRLLYLPAGLSASTSVSIPADSSEAIIPITANASAALGNWPMIVIGTVETGYGTIELATQPVNLEVAESPFTFEFPKTSAELDGEAQVQVRVTVNRKLDGPAEIEMVGFPAGVTPLVPKVSVSQETESLSFPIKIASNARVGQHKTLVCKATIHAPGGKILQTNGNGTLQIDPPAPNSKPKDGGGITLSRLEQLRQNREQQ